MVSGQIQFKNSWSPGRDRSVWQANEALTQLPCEGLLLLSLSSLEKGGKEGKARMEGGEHDEEVAFSKETKSRLECKNWYPIYY